VLKADAGPPAALVVPLVGERHARELDDRRRGEGEAVVGDPGVHGGRARLRDGRDRRRANGVRLPGQVLAGRADQVRLRALGGQGALDLLRLLGDLLPRLLGLGGVDRELRGRIGPALSHRVAQPRLRDHPGVFVDGGCGSGGGGLGGGALGGRLGGHG
jgi:hypothetical protein